MALPTSINELNERIQANQRIEGYGDQTTTFIPCPFCGAADWLKFPVTAGLTEYKEQQEPHHCKECDRTAAMRFERDGGSISMRLVQLGGPDPPEWLQFRVPRENI